MKPKQTQILGLLITLLLSLIIYDFYIIYSINAYIKLDQSDVTTSFAIVDALFFQVIKLIVISFIIFALSVEIRGIYILRERLKKKLQVVLKKSIDEQLNETQDRLTNLKNSFTLNDLVKEFDIQADSAKIEFEPVKRVQANSEFLKIVDRYGTFAMATLNKSEQEVLLKGTDELKRSILSKLQDYYQKNDHKRISSNHLEQSNNVKLDLMKLDIKE